MLSLGGRRASRRSATTEVHVMMSRRSIVPCISALFAGAVLGLGLSEPASAQTSPLGQAVTNAAAAAAAESSAAAAPQAPSPPAENPVLTFFKGTELMGFVDTYYSYNFNTPAAGCATVGGVAIFNCLHNFDVAHNSFSLNLAELALEKKPTMESKGGYRIDLDYGPTASIVAGAEPGGVSVFQNIQQAYISYLAPAGKGTLQFDFGKFVTMMGNEVIETKDNWNYSRSLLFALAIPYYHSGIRVVYSPNDKLGIQFHVVNGWNNVVDNNPAKSIGGSITYKPTGAFTFIENWYGGPEATGNPTPPGWRHTSDTIVSYTLNKMSSVALNYDVGHDASSHQVWQGVALYYKYQANDWFAIVPRYEFLKDKDAFMTGQPQNMQEFTLTTEFKHKDGVMMRIEYRGDFSNLSGGYFLKNAGELSKSQNALTVGWVYAFSSR